MDVCEYQDQQKFKFLIQREVYLQITGNLRAY